jgi:hypothetical protein
LRGIERPLHLVAAESALVGECLKRQVREGAADPAQVEQTEANWPICRG